MEETKTQTAKWVKIVLAISLALNLAVVGIFGGAALKGQPSRVKGAEGVSILARALPLKYQSSLRGALRDRREDLKPDREAMLALRNNLIAALEAEPFDIAAVESVFVQQHDLLSNLVDAGHDEVIRQIATMDARDRAAYVENLQRPMRAPQRDGQ